MAENWRRVGVVVGPRVFRGKRLRRGRRPRSDISTRRTDAPQRSPTAPPSSPTLGRHCCKQPWNTSTPPKVKTPTPDRDPQGKKKKKTEDRGINDHVRKYSTNLRRIPPAGGEGNSFPDLHLRRSLCPPPLVTRACFAQLFVFSSSRSSQNYKTIWVCHTHLCCMAFCRERREKTKTPSAVFGSLGGCASFVRARLLQYKAGELRGGESSVCSRGQHRSQRRKIIPHSQ